MHELIIYVLCVFAGATLEVIILRLYTALTHKKLHIVHTWFARYVFMLSFPLLATVLLFIMKGYQLVQIFFIFMCVGPIFEYLVGYFYKHIVGNDLWTYKHYAIGRYTSVLTLPLWGMAGVLFYLIADGLR